MTHVLAVDPGKATGVAWWTPGHLWSGEFPLHQALRFCEDYLEQYGRDTLVVGEQFTVNARTLKTAGGDWWSLKGLGALEYLTLKHEATWCTPQLPGDAKKLMTNRRLEHLGWRNPTPGDHADDATRHAGLLLCKRGLLTSRELGPA